MIDDDELLGKEADHRIRNSLQLVASLLQIQARRGGRVDAAAELLAASRRVACIAAVHERLYRDPRAGFVALRPYLEELCVDLERSRQSDGRHPLGGRRGASSCRARHGFWTYHYRTGPQRA